MHIQRRHFLAMTLASSSLALAGCVESSPVFRSINLTNSAYPSDFTLTDAAGTRHALRDFRGRYLLMFFGYTQCPDVCPTALSRAVEIRRLLGERKDALQVAFISVDPERDTPAIAAAYAKAFDPGFVGMSGGSDQIAKLAEAYRVFYRKVPTGSSYSIDHTALSYVIDPEGHVRLAFRHEQSARECAEDLHKLMRYDAGRTRSWA